MPEKASLLGGSEGCILQILEVKVDWVLEEVSNSHQTLCVGTTLVQKPRQLGHWIDGSRDIEGADHKTTGDVETGFLDLAQVSVDPQPGTPGHTQGAGHPESELSGLS